MSKEEIDCEFNKEIVCPYCGYEHGDSWEFKENNGEMVCDGCEKKFNWKRDIEVTYSTWVIKE